MGGGWVGRVVKGPVTWEMCHLMSSYWALCQSHLKACLPLLSLSCWFIWHHMFNSLVHMKSIAWFSVWGSGLQGCSFPLWSKTLACLQEPVICKIEEPASLVAWLLMLLWVSSSPVDWGLLGGRDWSWHFSRYSPIKSWAWPRGHVRIFGWREVILLMEWAGRSYCPISCDFSLKDVRTWSQNKLYPLVNVLMETRTNFKVRVQISVRMRVKLVWD